MDFTQIPIKHRNISIVALNAVSTLAQIGQYGLGTTLLPIALVANGATPAQIGVTTSAFWLGTLIGILISGHLIRMLGYRNTVIVGLVVSALSFILMPLMNWQWWSLPATAIGIGLGLRWIANETWLYRLAPPHARGRIIGIHETLISIAAISAPLIIVGVGAAKSTAFWIASTVVLLAIFPLFAAATIPASENSKVVLTSARNSFNFNQYINQSLTYLMGFGALMAGLGGWMEGSLLAFIPMYSADVGIETRDVAWLLTILGVGSMTCQIAIGWLADNKGVLWTSTLTAIAASAAVLIAIIFGKSFLSLAIVMFILGGVAGALLTLGIFWATLENSGESLSRRVRQVSIVYTTLSAAGPFVAGFIVSQTSSASLFWQLLAVIAVIIKVLLKQSKETQV